MLTVDEIIKKFDQTVSDEEMDHLLAQIEQYHDIGEEAGKTGTLINDWLLILYIALKRPKEACFMIAKDKIDLWDVMYRMQRHGLPEALKVRGIKENESLLNQLYSQMVESDSSYEEYCEILSQYPCGEYAQVLILYARKEDRRADTIALSNLMKKTVLERRARANSFTLYDGGYQVTPQTVMMSYYTDRLGDLSYVQDYQETRKCVNEAMRIYRYEQEALLYFSPEWLPRFWTNLLCCLNFLGRYDRTVELSQTIHVKITDPNYYFYVAEAYYAQNHMEKARKYAKRSAALESGQKNLLLLAQIYITLREYKEAERLLLQSIGMLSQVIEDRYVDNSGMQYTERTNTRELYESEYRKKFESPYTLLFLCYVYEEDYVKAKVFYEEIEEKLGNTDMVMISAALLHVNEKAKGRIAEIEAAKYRMRAQLEQLQKDQEQKSQLLKQWTLLLVECQVGDEIADISEAYWDEHVREQMECAIQKISSMIRKANESGYAEKEKEVRKQFPKMREDAVKFLASADQMYEVFHDNPIIDFAPVMVEYCKVIEVLLWEYLDHTDEYVPEIQRNKNPLKTLGTAAWVIIQGGRNKSLYPYGKDIEWINILRCESAHKEKSREPDVKKVQKYIKESSLVQRLCS